MLTFEKMFTHGNHFGLFSEENDSSSERFLAAVTGQATALATGLDDSRFGREVALMHADEVAAAADYGAGDAAI